MYCKCKTGVHSDFTRNKIKFFVQFDERKRAGKRTVEGAMGVYVGHTKPPTKCHEIIFQQKDY